eukprot:2835110-Alexandrium_andersonii.AAC.1
MPRELSRANPVLQRLWLRFRIFASAVLRRGVRVDPRGGLVRLPFRGGGRLRERPHTATSGRSHLNRGRRGAP